MEQRLQDIASLFNPIPGMGVGMGPADMAPYSHYPSHYSYQVYNLVTRKIFSFQLIKQNVCFCRARDQYHNMVNSLIHIPILMLFYTMHHWLNWAHHNHIMDQIWVRPFHPVCTLQIQATMEMVVLPAIKWIMTT